MLLSCCRVTEGKIMMTILNITSRLTAAKETYHQKYGVKTLALFGSFARGEQTMTSDIDILVEFDRPIGLAFIQLADELEQLLDAKVDLVTRRAIQPRMMKYIEPDLIYV